MSRTEIFEEVRVLADSICDETVTPKEMVQLETLLADSDEARKFYLDYVGMHAYMQSENSPQFEIVMRRLQVEEVIIRPVGSGGSGGFGAPGNTSFTDGGPKRLSDNQSAKSNSLRYIIIIIAMLVISFTAYYLGKGQNSFIATIESGSLMHSEQGTFKNQGLAAGRYTASKDAKIVFANGEIFKVAKDSQLELMSPQQIRLLSGELEQLATGDSDFSIQCEYFSLSSEEGLKVTINKDDLQISTKAGQALLTPKKWRPRHYWNFDEKSDRALDTAGDAHGFIGETTQKVAGLTGSGAYSFNNKSTDYIGVGSGGGTALATGSFSVTEGVTIEALFKSSWSTKSYDEIFRKDRDGNMRMVLSFQNDSKTKARKMSFPKVAPGPVLSFGLFLVGQGYHELEMLLDGQNGRPTLEELTTQTKTHVAATYDVRSGLKALYINGKIVASHQYPPGTKMLSGGPGKATIGNSPNFNEPFNGIIDEVAFYDFALPHYIINLHHDLTSQGKSYFDSDSTENLPEEINIPLPANATIKINPLSGLPE